MQFSLCIRFVRMNFYRLWVFHIFFCCHHTACSKIGMKSSASRVADVVSTFHSTGARIVKVNNHISSLLFLSAASHTIIFRGFSSSDFYCSTTSARPHLTHIRMPGTRSRLSIEPPHINMKVLNEREIQTVITCVFVTHALCSCLDFGFRAYLSRRAHTIK